MTFRTRSSVSLPPSLCFCKSLTSAVSQLAPGQSCWLTPPTYTPLQWSISTQQPPERRRCCQVSLGMGKVAVPLVCEPACPSSLPAAHSWARGSSAPAKCSHFPGRADRRLRYTVKHGVTGTILNVHYIHILRSLLVPALSSINR